MRLQRKVVEAKGMGTAFTVDGRGERTQLSEDRKRRRGGAGGLYMCGDGRQAGATLLTQSSGNKAVSREMRQRCRALSTVSEGRQDNVNVAVVKESEESCDWVQRQASVCFDAQLRGR